MLSLTSIKSVINIQWNLCSQCHESVEKLPGESICHKKNPRRHIFVVDRIPFTFMITLTNTKHSPAPAALALWSRVQHDIALFGPLNSGGEKLKKWVLCVFQTIFRGYKYKSRLQYVHSNEVAAIKASPEGVVKCSHCPFGAAVVLHGANATFLPKLCERSGRAPPRHGIFRCHERTATYHETCQLAQSELDHSLLQVIIKTQLQYMASVLNILPCHMPVSPKEPCIVLITLPAKYGQSCSSVLNSTDGKSDVGQFRRSNRDFAYDIHRSEEYVTPHPKPKADTFSGLNRNPLFWLLTSRCSADDSRVTAEHQQPSQVFALSTPATRLLA